MDLCLDLQERRKSMYIYVLNHDHAGDEKIIGYYTSWKKARKVMKEYRSSVEGFKHFPNQFSIKKIRVNEDNYYFL
jgi:hypothetical protein